MNIKSLVLGSAAALLMSAGAMASDLASVTKATYKIFEGERGMCSSTFLRNDAEGALFLTAAHCVTDNKGQYNLRVQKQTIGEFAYETLSEQVYYVKNVRVLEKADVALIQLKDKSVRIDAEPVDFATQADADKIAIGTPVIAVGYPAGLELTVSKGEFTGATPGLPSLDITGPLYRFTATVIGGNSGGGLYAEIDGTYKYLGTVNAVINPAYSGGLIQWGTTPATIQKLLGLSANTKRLPSAGSIDAK